jgi:hypothetical protein
MGLLRNPTLESGRRLTRKRPSATAAFESLSLATLCRFGQRGAHRCSFNSPSIPGFAVPYRFLSSRLMRLASATMVSIGGFPSDRGRIVASATYTLSGSLGL